MQELRNPRVGVYLRVSTLDQNTELQRREILEYLAARGWSRFEVFEDKGKSGTHGDRPALKKLLAATKARKVDVVVCWKLDRLFRSLRHLVNLLSDWDALGVTFLSLKDQIDLTTPSGRLLVQLLGAFAEFEAALIRERVRAGQAAARAKGKHMGRPKIRDDAKILELRRQGLSLRQIAAKLQLGKGSVQAALASAGDVD